MLKIKNFNDGWTFSKEPLTFKDFRTGEKIDLPHTWNAEDGQDGGNDYYRGECYYAKEFDLSDKDASLILPVKILAKMCAELLYDNAAKAYEVKKNFKPVFTKKEYIDYLDGLFYVKELP